MIYPFVGNYGVTRPFGVYDSAYSAYPDSKHPGTDYAVPFRNPYVAAISGTVVVFDRGLSTTGRGKEVRIVDGDVEVRYCHLDTIYVKEGQRVTEGQQVGTCGYTGYVVDANGNIGTPAGAHLHFELLVNGVYTDFEKYMKGVDANMYQEEKPNGGDADNIMLPGWRRKATEEEKKIMAAKGWKKVYYDSIKAQLEWLNKEIDKRDKIIADLKKPAVTLKPGKYNVI